MDKLTAYRRGHFRLTINHEPFHQMPDLYWVRFIDALGIWTVLTEEPEKNEHSRPRNAGHAA